MKKSGKITIRNGLITDDMWGIPTFGRPLGSLLTLLDINQFKKPVWIATINPEFVMNALKDPVFFRILRQETTVNVLDGIGLVWAREVLKAPRWKRLWTGMQVGVGILQGGYRKNLISGVELIDQLCSKAVKEKRRAFFLGGWSDRSKRSAKYFGNKYPGLQIRYSVGRPVETDREVLTKINKFQPDYLFVAYAMKKQELWIRENLHKLKVGVVVGVGRSFDYYSGDLKRAPLWVRQMGFEWLYSLYKEPKRWRRQLELPKFIWKVLTW